MGGILLPVPPKTLLIITENKLDWWFINIDVLLSISRRISGIITKQNKYNADNGYDYNFSDNVYEYILTMYTSTYWQCIRVHTDNVYEYILIMYTSIYWQCIRVYTDNRYEYILTMHMSTIILQCKMYTILCTWA